MDLQFRSHSLYKYKDLLREFKNAVHEIEFETFYVSQGLSNTTHHLGYVSATLTAKSQDFYILVVLGDRVDKGKRGGGDTPYAPRGPKDPPPPPAGPQSTSLSIPLAGGRMRSI